MKTAQARTLLATVFTAVVLVAVSSAKAQTITHFDIGVNWDSEYNSSFASGGWGVVSGKDTTFGYVSFEAYGGTPSSWSHTTWSSGCDTYEGTFGPGNGGTFFVDSMEGTGDTPLVAGSIVDGSFLWNDGPGSPDCPWHYPGSGSYFRGTLDVTWANPRIFRNGIVSGAGSFSTNNYDPGYFGVYGQVTPTPEPSSLLLLATGLLSSMGVIRRARKL